MSVSLYYFCPKICVRVCSVALWCLTLCDHKDCTLPVSSVHGIFQARILEWIVISFSEDLPDPGIAPGSPALREDSLLSEPPGKPQACREHLDLMSSLWCLVYNTTRLECT